MLGFVGWLTFVLDVELSIVRFGFDLYGMWFYVMCVLLIGMIVGFVDILVFESYMLFFVVEVIGFCIVVVCLVMMIEMLVGFMIVMSYGDVGSMFMLFVCCVM